MLMTARRSEERIGVPLRRSILFRLCETANQPYVSHWKNYPWNNCVTSSPNTGWIQVGLL